MVRLPASGCILNRPDICRYMCFSTCLGLQSTRTYGNIFDPRRTYSRCMHNNIGKPGRKKSPDLLETYEFQWHDQALYYCHHATVSVSSPRPHRLPFLLFFCGMWAATLFLTLSPTQDKHNHDFSESTYLYAEYI